jgi:uncharacterized protein (TIGR00730 family)
VKQICVFCGSSPGEGQDYIKAARSMGQALAKRDITLVYGGASVGMMGQLAKACLDAGGEVIGVIPRKLVEMEVAFTQLAQLHVVESMHERKAKMAEMADGFIALPGGLGTIEEFFEVLTWAQLGMHRKPCGLLNTCRYYDKLIDFLDQAVEQQFVEPVHREMIQIDESPDGLLKKFETYQAPQTNKAAWVLQMTNKAKGV